MGAGVDFDWVWAAELAFSITFFDEWPVVTGRGQELTQMKSYSAFHLIINVCSLDKTSFSGFHSFSSHFQRTMNALMNRQGSFRMDTHSGPICWLFLKSSFWNALQQEEMNIFDIALTMITISFLLFPINVMIVPSTAVQTAMLNASIFPWSWQACCSEGFMMAKWSKGMLKCNGSKVWVEDTAVVHTFASSPKSFAKR